MSALDRSSFHDAREWFFAAAVGLALSAVLALVGWFLPSGVAAGWAAVWIGFGFVYWRRFTVIDRRRAEFDAEFDQWTREQIEQIKQDRARHRGDA